jgi:hypothetical protein
LRRPTDPAPTSATSESRALAYALFGVALAFFAVDFAIYLTPRPILTYGVSYLVDLHENQPDLWQTENWHTTYYPPLYDLFLQAMAAIWGMRYVPVLLTNALAIPLAAAYLFGLARRIGLGRYAYLPPFVFVLLPGTFEAARSLAIEMTLVPAVPALAYHLAAADRFRRRGHALAAGTWAGVALLGKWTFPAYAIGFALIAGIALVVGAEGRRLQAPTRRQIGNVALALLVPIALAGWWYAFRLDWATFFATAANDPNTLESTYRTTLTDYVSMLKRLTGSTVATPLAAVVGVGLLVSKRPFAVLATVFAAVVLPLLILAIPEHGEWRYLQPLMPGVALAAAVAVSTARWEAARLLLATALLAGAMQAHFAFFGCEARREREPAEQIVRAPEESDLIAHAILAAAGPRRETRVGVTVYPFGRDPHLSCEYVKYRLIRRGEFDRFDFPCFAPPEYVAFRRGLHAGRFDLLLFDCGPTADCGADRSRMATKEVTILEQRGYVDQVLGTRRESYTMADVDGDWEAIRLTYRRVFVLALGDGTYPALFARVGFREERSGGR